MSQSTDQYDKQRRHNYHSANLQNGQQGEGEAAEILRALSEINDLPIQPQDDPVMGQLVSKLTSTANLSAEEVRSNEWVREYILILYLCKFPTHDGLSGTRRGWAHGDSDAEREPLDPETRMMLEAHVTSSKLALSRSEDFTGPKEAVRNVSESIVNEEGEGGSSGGLLGRLRS
jgi:hypothetical protein